MPEAQTEDTGPKFKKTRYGRNPGLEAEDIDDLRRQAYERDQSKSSFVDETLRTALLQKMRERAEARGGNKYTIAKLDEKTFEKYKNMIIGEEQKDTKPQNTRRMEALSCIISHLQCIIMWPACYKDGMENTTLHTQFRVFNQDSTHLLLQDSQDNVGTIYMAAGSRKELHKKQLNPASTTSREVGRLKRRGIGLNTCIQAAPGLSSVIVKIKDGSFKEFKEYKVRFVVQQFVGTECHDRVQFFFTSNSCRRSKTAHTKYAYLGFHAPTAPMT